MANKSALLGQFDQSLTLDTHGQFRVGLDGELEVAPNAIAPAAHASTHGSLGADPLTLAQSQVTNLTTDLAGKVSKLGDTIANLTVSDLTSGQVLIASTGGRLITSGALLFDLATGNITHSGTMSTYKIGIGTVPPTLGGTKLSVGTSLGSFGGSYAMLHVVDNSVNATVNYQNTNAAGYTAFDLFNSAGTKVGTFAWSNSGAGFLPNVLWFMTRTASDMVLGTNTTERLRIGASGVRVGTGGTPLSQIAVYLPTLTPASVDASDGYVEQLFTVTGLSTSDTVTVNPPVMMAPPHCQLIAWRVSAADTLALTFHSVSGSHLPPQGVYRVVAHRS